MAKGRKHRTGSETKVITLRVDGHEKAGLEMAREWRGETSVSETIRNLIELEVDPDLLRAEDKEACNAVHRLELKTGRKPSRSERNNQPQWVFEFLKNLDKALEDPKRKERIRKALPELFS